MFVPVRVRNEATCYRGWLVPPWYVKCEDSPCGQKTQLDRERKFPSPLGVRKEFILSLGTKEGSHLRVLLIVY
ncbi:hypothetical protein TNCV_1502651 [Trichonephila clavipes]|uniref:Uncharacterized protein n=1 Tax=Trichonephila clavipes TaxID=2585209 RepID=A0A8X6V8E0_TRICX|nr:hypothetical protein TNCV_1502651 [Trichonephila clavipes]